MATPNRGDTAGRDDDEGPLALQQARRRGRGTDGRLSETAQQAIKEYIRKHGLRANAPLPPEAQLAQELRVGRTSIREAIKALESLGIVEVRRGVGLFVRPFSLDPILDNLDYGLLHSPRAFVDALEMRKHLEASFIEEVARTASANQLRVLRSIVDHMGEDAAAGTPHSWAMVEEDHFFHRALYAGLGNRLLLRTLDVYWELYRRISEEALLVEPAGPVSRWEIHRRIVEALERQDPPAARAAMLAHFRGIEGRVERAQIRAEAATDNH